MPAPPAPGFVPTYYLDGNEAWLGWTDPKTGEPHPETPDIAWPFQDEDSAHFSDLVRLGFTDAEDYPEEPFVDTEPAQLRGRNKLLTTFSFNSKDNPHEP